MERSSVTRYLRYTVTALSLTACVLLVALWVRSYWWVYRITYGSTNNDAVVYCASGHGGFYWTEKTPPTLGWSFTSYPRPLGERTQSAWTWGSAHLGIAAPVWLLASIPLFFSVIPWLHWRFSLRTLLIATTLVAMGLGAIVAVW